MSRQYIKDGKGNPVRTSNGERLFWSDKDGDSDRSRQTVYREHKGFFGGSSKVSTRYDPTTGKFTK